MASAISIAINPIFKIKQKLGTPLLSNNLNDEDLISIIAEHTYILSSASAYTFQSNGGGWYSYGTPNYLNHMTLTTGVDDHLYLLYPNGLVRQFDVQKIASTITSAPSNTLQNNRWQLNDSAADFSTDVAIGDYVVMSNGASAEIIAVDSANDALETKPLNYDTKYVVGATYYIVRAPGTSVVTQHTVTGYDIDLRTLELTFWQRLLSSRSLQSSSSTDTASISPEFSVDNIRKRIQHLRGVIGG